MTSRRDVMRTALELVQLEAAALNAELAKLNERARWISDSLAKLAERAAETAAEPTRVVLEPNESGSWLRVREGGPLVSGARVELDFDRGAPPDAASEGVVRHVRDYRSAGGVGGGVLVSIEFDDGSRDEFRVLPRVAP